MEYQEAAVLGFLDSLKTAKKAITETDASDFKNFLSRLALVQRVSTSTQNQAFNAILFFFRYVQEKEVVNLADTVRAKRGQKLPVVFSVEEVKREKNLTIQAFLHPVEGNGEYSVPVSAS